MGDEKHIHQECPACQGSGQILENADSAPHGSNEPLEYEPCPRCNATGEILFGKLDDDFITVLQDIEGKIDGVREVVDEIKTTVDAL